MMVKDFRKKMAQEIQRLHANNNLAIVTGKIAEEIQGILEVQDELKERLRALEDGSK